MTQPRQSLTPRVAAGRSYFATCPRGLEALLERELAQVGAAELAATSGGVAFTGSLETCYRANLSSRFATRILKRLARKHYRNEQQVYDAAYDLPWHGFFAPSNSIRVDVNAVRSPLKSLEYITLRIKDAVCDRFRAESGRRPDVDTRTPDVRLHAFLDADTVSIYLDTSGEPLYKRGYRAHFAEAPLKENLAAGIIALTGWQPQEPLIDPMCGGGTLLVEAAMMGLAVAPGQGRRFGFERLADFDAALWQRLREQALHTEQRSRPLALFGSDLHGREVEGARANVEAAGLADRILLKQAQVTDLRPPGALAGVVVMNPPYGIRMGEEDQLAALYPRVGDWLKQHFAGWRCYIFSGDASLPRGIRLHASRRTPLYNGAIECRLYEYKLVAGSMRRKKEA